LNKKLYNWQTPDFTLCIIIIDLGLGLEPKLTARRYAREYIGGAAAAMHFGNLKFGEMEFGEMKLNTSNWSNFCMLLRRTGLTASAGLSCITVRCTS